MKNLNEYLNEELGNKQPNVMEGEIKSEKDFRDWARAKFEEVFGDELDEQKMKETVDGFLEDNKDDVEKGNWGELVGKFNQSFAPDNKE